MIIDTRFEVPEGEDQIVRTVRFGDGQLFGVANDLFVDIDGDAGMALGFGNVPIDRLKDCEIMLHFVTPESIQRFIDSLQQLKESHMKQVGETE